MFSKMDRSVISDCKILSPQYDTVIKNVLGRYGTGHRIVSRGNLPQPARAQIVIRNIQNIYTWPQFHQCASETYGAPVMRSLYSRPCSRYDDEEAVESVCLVSASAV